MKSSVHIDNNKKNMIIIKKDILILDKGPAQGLENTTLSAEK